MRNPDELLWAAAELADEWRVIAEVASRLSQVEGSRTSAESADLDAGLLHYRAVVNFCCGDYCGRRHHDDITPEDLIGRDWWPDDEEFDRRLRGRLGGINKALAHLSWKRRDLSIIWPFGLLAHEADYALRLFVAEVPDDEPVLAVLRDAAAYAKDVLPAREQWTTTTVEPAPKRSPVP
jgi:hypothetical protein